MEGSAGPDLLHGPPPLIPQDVLYEFRLVAFADSYVSDPSNIANISTSGENPMCGGEGGVVKVGWRLYGASLLTDPLSCSLPRSGGVPLPHTATGSPAPACIGWCCGWSLLLGRGRPCEHPGCLPHESAKGSSPSQETSTPGWVPSLTSPRLLFLLHSHHWGPEVLIGHLKG